MLVQLPDSGCGGTIPPRQQAKPTKATQPAEEEQHRCRQRDCRETELECRLARAEHELVEPIVSETGEPEQCDIVIIRPAACQAKRIGDVRARKGSKLVGSAPELQLVIVVDRAPEEPERASDRVVEMQGGDGRLSTAHTVSASDREIALRFLQPRICKR